MAGQTATIGLKIVGDASGAERSLQRAATATEKFETSVRKAAVPAAAALGAIGVGALKAAEAAEATSTANARLETTLRNAGDASGEAAAAAKQYADALEAQTGVSDETIKAGQAVLATFHNVSDEAGRASGAFDRATAAAVDLSAAGFGSVESASMMLGKALQDPLKGMGALAESGVTFTDAQKAMVESMVATGDIAGAQNIILQEVEGQVQGTAAATVNASDQMRNAWQDALAALGGTDEATGQLTGLAKASQDAAAWVERHSTAVVLGIKVVAAFAATILVTNLALKAYRTAVLLMTAAQTAARVASVAWTRAVWLLNVALLMNPIGLVVIAVVALVAAFVLAYKKSDAFRAAVDRLGASISGAFASAFGAAGRAVHALMGKLRAAWDLVRKLLDKLPGVKMPGGSSRAVGPQVPMMRGARSGASGAVAVVPGITVNVGVGDPHAIARTIRRVLAGDASRLGRDEWAGAW